MWLDVVVGECRDAATVIPGLPIPADVQSASIVASAFQAVHVLSFAHANGYLVEGDMGPFTRVLCDGLTDGHITHHWKRSVERYTELKAKPVEEQLLRFAEETVGSLLGSPGSGIALGPALLPLANEFLTRSFGITADFFGDEQTMQRMANAVRTAAEDEPAQAFDALPEWLEEKATDAPTLFRVVMDAVDLRLRRDYPRVLGCSGWSGFKLTGMIGGCVALALRLHVDIPEGFRTPLERTMRSSIETAFPGGDALYNDCVVRVREALLEIPRPKRQESISVLISTWVFSTIADDDSLIEDAQLVAELAHVYENETNGFWVSDGIY